MSYPMPGPGAGVDPIEGRGARRSLATTLVLFGVLVVVLVVVLLVPLRAESGQVFGFGKNVRATVTAARYVRRGYKTSPHDQVTVRWTDENGTHTGSDTTSPGRFEVGDTVIAHVSGDVVSLQTHGTAVALVCLFAALIALFAAFAWFGGRGWARLRRLPAVAPQHRPVRLELGRRIVSRGTVRLRWATASGVTGRFQVFRRADRSMPEPGEMVDAYPYAADGHGPFLLRSLADGRWTYASGRRLPVG